VPNFLAMSFEGRLAPSFDLLCLEPGGVAPDGWGIGFYPGNEPSASVFKEPNPQKGGIRSELVRAWDRLEASTFMLHIRHATWGGISDANTQPFHRTWGGRDWLFSHAGSLHQRYEPAEPLLFEPVGYTDSELVFGVLMTRIAEKGWKRLTDADPQVLYGWFRELNPLGGLTTMLTDGETLLVYADDTAEGRVHVCELRPPYGFVVIGDHEVRIDLTRRGVKSRSGIIISSEPLDNQGTSLGLDPKSVTTPVWRPLTPGTMLLIRQGRIVEQRAPEQPSLFDGANPATLQKIYGTRIERLRRGALRNAHIQTMAITHRTVYRYEKPVEHSTHTLRLQPIHDRMQRLRHHELAIRLDGEVFETFSSEYDDVFGNRARSFAVERPYSEFIIETRSVVELRDTNPFGSLSQSAHGRKNLPLVWMPWQRQVLEPYLLPPELPESQLQELGDYANSFVRRNDADLLDVLFDMNASIFSEYRYQPGSTSIFTTPFEVYANRRGVCQDFANLFICLARLLGVPARYTCGYIYVGPREDGELSTMNTSQAEASHAWVQVYIPKLGWVGFDPTNGILAQTEHIRVAVGRNYIDATPTSGTLYVGGGRETLEVAVRVAKVD
jgi:transglutaminase-like putative cysteine protease/predicted glutamine amidotransferase